MCAEQGTPTLTSEEISRRGEIPRSEILVLQKTVLVGNLEC